MVPFPLDNMSATPNLSIIGEKLLRIGLVLLGAYLSKRTLIKAIRRTLITLNHGVSKEIKIERVRTLNSVLSNLASLIIGAVTALIILSEIGVDITPLIAGIGILGLGASFASQTLVKDYIAGFFILFENQFNIGDRIEIGGKRGTVEELSLRTTVLKDDEGNTHIIPNSKITTVTRYKSSR